QHRRLRGGRVPAPVRGAVRLAGTPTVHPQVVQVLSFAVEQWAEVARHDHRAHRLEIRHPAALVSHLHFQVAGFAQGHDLAAVVEVSGQGNLTQEVLAGAQDARVHLAVQVVRGGDVDGVDG